MNSPQQPQDQPDSTTFEVHFWHDRYWLHHSDAKSEELAIQQCKAVSKQEPHIKFRAVKKTLKVLFYEH